MENRIVKVKDFNVDMKIFSSALDCRVVTKKQDKKKMVLHASLWKCS